MVVVGPTVVAGKHHQRVVFGFLICTAEVWAALQPCLEGCGVHSKILKNTVKVGYESIAGRL